MGNIMLVFFVYDASSCTVFNRENENTPNYERQELGRYIVNLDPLHLSRELRWVIRRLKRLGYNKSHTHQMVCAQVAHGLRAKEHFCVEI
jgi:uncharacterized protein YllA (UPF0747 family)